MPATPDRLIHELLSQEREVRDRLQQQVHALQERLALVQAQTGDLQSYRQHYQDHWQAQFRSGATPTLMQCYRQFEDRLQAALAQQHHTAHHVQGLLQQAQQRRLQQEVRVASIEKLLERRRGHARASEARAQQRSDDEWAQRAQRALNAAQPGLAVSGA